MPIRPPGTRTRNISASTAGLSVDRLITQLEITTSTDASGSGRSSISPLRNSTFSAPALAALARARVSMSSVMSTPYANPDGPTRRADSSTSMPPPDPRSKTFSPSCRFATASGFPQPRLASTASSGSPSVSPSRYSEPGKSSAESDAAEPVPQHDSVADLSEHAAVTPGPSSRTARAAMAYRARTASRRSVDVLSVIAISPDIDDYRCQPCTRDRQMSMPRAYWPGDRPTGAQATATAPAGRGVLHTAGAPADHRQPSHQPRPAAEGAGRPYPAEAGLHGRRPRGRRGMRLSADRTTRPDPADHFAPPEDPRRRRDLHPRQARRLGLLRTRPLSP